MAGGKRRGKRAAELQTPANTTKRPSRPVSETPTASANSSFASQDVPTSAEPSVGRGFGTGKGKAKGSGGKYIQQQANKERKRNDLMEKRANDPRQALIDLNDSIKRKLEHAASLPLNTKDEQIARIQKIAQALTEKSPYEGQVETLLTFHEDPARDCIYLSGTGSGKSLIFQLLPFLKDPLNPGVVIVLMPLKVLCSEQMANVNRMCGGRAAVLNGDNNNQDLRREIATGGLTPERPYTHIFTSPEIALQKGFQRDILNNDVFSKRLVATVVDELHLTYQWGFSFRPEYKLIKALRQRCLHGLPLLGVSATVAAGNIRDVQQICGFKKDTKVIQASLDRPNIQKINMFTRYSLESFKDLMFLFKKGVLKASDLAKICIYMDDSSGCMKLVEVIRSWFRILGYPPESKDWVASYFSWKPEWDKDRIAKEFEKVSEHATIRVLIATDAYGMGVDNPDIRIVVVWGMPQNSDQKEQRQGRAVRANNKQQGWAIWVIPKSAAVTQESEISARKTDAYAKSVIEAAESLRADNRDALPAFQKLVTRQLDEIIDVEGNEDMASEDDSGAEESEIDMDELSNGIMAIAPITETKKKKGRSTPAMMRSRMDPMLFAEANVCHCSRLFSLYPYNDTTYGKSTDANNPTLDLPPNCCHFVLPERKDNVYTRPPCCQSGLPEWWNEEDWLQQHLPPLTNAMRINIGHRLSALELWRKSAWKDEILSWLAIIREQEDENNSTEIPIAILDEWIAGEYKSPSTTIDFLKTKGIKDPFLIACFRKLSDWVYGTSTKMQDAIVNDDTLWEWATLQSLDKRMFETQLSSEGYDIEWVRKIYEILAKFPVVYQEEKNDDDAAATKSKGNQKASDSPEDPALTEYKKWKKGKDLQWITFPDYLIRWRLRIKRDLYEQTFMKDDTKKKVKASQKRWKKRARMEVQRYAFTKVVLGLNTQERMRFEAFAGKTQDPAPATKKGPGGRKPKAATSRKAPVKAPVAKSNRMLELQVNASQYDEQVRQEFQRRENLVQHTTPTTIRQWTNPMTPENFHEESTPSRRRGRGRQEAESPTPQQ